jgi:hypothetical protein
LINEEGLWQTILCKKYLSQYTIGKAERKPGDSHFWSGLMKAKEALELFANPVLERQMAR